LVLNVLPSTLMVSAACIACLFAFACSTHAGALRDGVPDIQYRQHSDPFQGSALWISVEISGQRKWYGSAVRLNEWYGLSAAHVFYESGILSTNARVGTGRNFMTDRGVTRKITSFLLVPGWHGSPDPFDGQPDLAIIKFHKPLPGRNLSIATNLVRFESVVTSVGFGRSGYIANGYGLVDGNRRAFDGIFSRFNSFNPYLATFQFSNDPFYDGVYYGGKGLGGDSGSGSFNAAGQLVGITVAASNPTDTPSLGATYFMYLDLVRDWITTNTIITEPRLIVDHSGADLILSWNSDYQLQSSTNANGTYVDVSGAGSPYTNSTTLPSQFFRLAGLPEPPLQAPTVTANFGALGTSAQATAYYCAHQVSGAISDGSSLAVRMPAEPGGDGGVVEVPYQAVFNPTNSFSVELWAKPAKTVIGALASSRFQPASYPNGGWVLSQGDSTFANGNGFRFDCYNTSGNTAATTAAVNIAVNTNAWYYLAAVFDGTNFTLYVNGANMASATLPVGQFIRPNLIRPLTFGCTSSYGTWYSGDLDEPAFYTNALSATQVLAHYQAGTNVTPIIHYAQVVVGDSPAGYWRLEEAESPRIPAALAPPATAPLLKENALLRQVPSRKLLLNKQPTEGKAGNL
jgi:hypothetical protein